MMYTSLSALQLFYYNFLLSINFKKYIDNNYFKMSGQLVLLKAKATRSFCPWFSLQY
jgi:hypothetical protein